MNLNKMYNLNLEITSIAIDSRECKSNCLFVCLIGEKFDGHNFIDDAIKNGAIAVLAERYIACSVPIIVVEDTTDELAKLANLFFGYPSKKLFMIGVTGTDGKTTTCSLIKSILDNSGYIGTNGVNYDNTRITLNNTTPNSLVLNSVLADMVASKIKTVAMEVSSHGLSQKRVNELDFDVAIFTNLSHEHLDYYKNMDTYFKAKSKLFLSLKDNSLAIINNDDPYGLILKTISKGKIITFGINTNADFQAINIKVTLFGMSFDLIIKKKLYKNLETNLVGEYNLYNLLSVMVVLSELGFSIKEIRKKIKLLDKVDGRLNFIENNKARIVVDFAHTPNALVNVLKTLKNDGNLILIFGATGNRDKSKRPLMGKIATEMADFVIFTEEDSYLEDPLDIISDLLSGVEKDNYIVIPNRKDAIKSAIKIASNNDTILIAGKGNERVLHKDNIVFPYNDTEEVLKYV